MKRLILIGVLSLIVTGLWAESGTIEKVANNTNDVQWGQHIVAYNNTLRTGGMMQVADMPKHVWSLFWDAYNKYNWNKGDIGFGVMITETKMYSILFRKTNRTDIEYYVWETLL
jgi:hypothetical protein